MKFILGQKKEMTQIWQGNTVVPVTKVLAGPCVVVQVKTKEKDGYQAVQIGFGQRKAKNIKKPQKGHLKGLGSFAYLREFRLDKDNGQPPLLKPGDVITAETFALGDKVKVTGISKGRGFQGVVKRHKFAGAPASHGTKDQLRMPGSIGATGPAHVFKGRRMPGHMGVDRVTVANLEIVKIDKEKNILYIKGAVPGARDSLVLIKGEGELKISPKPAPESKTNESKADKEPPAPKEKTESQGKGPDGIQASQPEAKPGEKPKQGKQQNKPQNN